MELPLTHLRVLDLLPVRHAMLGRLLADLGADVVLGSPRRAPTSRYEEVWQLAYDAGKRVAPLGAALTELTQQADVVLGSASSDVAGQVAVSLTEFGLTGPCKDWQGTDAVHLALSGALSCIGAPGRPPLLPPGRLGATIAAFQALWATLVAVRHASATGQPQVVDVSVLEALAQGLDPAYGIGGTAAGGRTAAEGPSGRPDAAHLYPVLDCRDGRVRIAVLAARQWGGMFSWLAQPEELSEPAYSSIVRRNKDHAILRPFLERHFASRTVAEALEQATAHGVPAARVVEPNDVHDSIHARKRGSFVRRCLTDGTSVAVAAGWLEIDGARARPQSNRPAADWSTLQGTSARNLTRPLEDVKVLDLGVIVAGAETSRLLADQGAHVVKVENAAFPDGSRQSVGRRGMNATVAWGHRNKESLGLDLRSARGKELFLALAAEADVVVSNFRPGTLESLGIGADVLHQVNPRLVVAQSSAYGARGPWSARMGYGPLVRAEAGITELWTYPDGTGGDAVTVYPDHTAARAVAAAVVAALVRRDRTGEGCTLDLAQQDVITSQVPVELTAPDDGQPLVDPVESTVSACAGDDDWVVVSVRDESDRAALARLLDGRTLAEWTLERTSAEAASELQTAGVPAGRMNRARELPQDPQLVARGFLRAMPHPLLERDLIGEARPAHFSTLPDPQVLPAPLPGQDSRAVLTAWLGLDPGTLDELVEQGVVQEPATREAVGA